jgi:hypothetical protein
MAALTVAAVIFAAVLYRLTQWTPPFYENAVRLEPQDLAAAGDQFERQVLDLNNALADRGHWQAVFTAEQMNGWLALEMPKKLPGLLPRELAEPRVEILPDQAQIACRYQGRKFSAVLSLAVSAFITDEPNVVAVRIRQARIGAVPGLKKQFVNQVSAAAARARIPLRWSQQDGDPIALISVTEHLQNDSRRLALETLQLREGELYLAGRTD